VPKKEPPYEIRRSSIQGRGAFATRTIRKGQRFAEYTGEAISHDEADRRYDDSAGRHHTFLFVLNDDVVIDARKKGADTRYINHSCDPNAESVIEDDHIWIEALRTIRPNDEITYDYRYEWQDDYDADDIRYYKCRCGTAKCRGTIVRVPAYMRATVKKWLAGEDVPKPRKPRKKSSAKKKTSRKAKKTSTRKSSGTSARKRRAA
jgi:SET domain-containing protein